MRSDLVLTQWLADHTSKSVVFKQNGDAAAERCLKASEPSEVIGDSLWWRQPELAATVN